MKQIIQTFINRPYLILERLGRTIVFTINYFWYTILNIFQNQVIIGSNPRILSVNALKVDKPYSKIQIGNSLVLYHRAEIMALGKGKIQIGNNCIIGNHFKLYCRDRVTLGDHVLISWNVQISDYDGHSIDPIERLAEIDHIQHNFFPNFSRNKSDEEMMVYREKYITKPVTIGDNVWIGANVLILKGVTIGANSVIAAGSVVTRDIPENTIAAGNPAKVVKEISIN